MTGGPPAARAPFRDADLDALLRLNAHRAAGEAAADLEAHFATTFAADRKLAVYGSLAPGLSNHRQVAMLRAEWRSGLTVRGELQPVGWGAGLGYPGLVFSPDGPPVDVQLLISPDLPAHWPRLDRFEGDDYLRILVPVHAGDDVVTVANLYQARPNASGLD